MIEQREYSRGVLGGRSVGKQESDEDLVGGGVGGVCDCCVGHELERHGRRIVHHSVEVLRDGKELRKTKEGEKRAIGSKLDANLLLGLASDCAIQLLDDLRRESRSGHGPNRLGAIVCQIELMDVC